MMPAAMDMLPSPAMRAGMTNDASENGTKEGGLPVALTLACHEAVR
jgi:hypothetical protein